MKGKLDEVQVGAPTQLLIHTIDIGMLVPPRDEFAFAKDIDAHREYFQTVPLSRLIVSQYAPLQLTEVMMPMVLSSLNPILEQVVGTMDRCAKA